MITGFCGGFTTFSTFMNENHTLIKEENFIYLAVYVVGSMALGFIALLVGNMLAKAIG